MTKGLQSDAEHEFLYRDNQYYRRRKGPGKAIDDVLGSDGRWKPYKGGHDRAFDHGMDGVLCDDPLAGKA